MPNEKNVAALTALTQDWFDDPEGLPPLAEWLASRGVLVPGALTDAEIDDIPMHNTEYFGMGDKASVAADAAIRVRFRTMLERIARGLN